MFDDSSVKTWASYFLRGLLYFGSIMNFMIFVGQELMFGWALVAKLSKDSSMHPFMERPQVQ